MIVSPRIGVFIIAVAWLVILYFMKQPYEFVIMSRHARRLKKHGRVYRTLMTNLMLKDALTGLRLPIVAVFATMQLIMGAYLASHHVDSSASIIFILVAALITSTLTEKFLIDEATMKSLIKTLPVDLKRYFWARIWSVSLVLALPSWLALLMQVPFSNVSLWGFLLSALAVFAVVFMWCGMQCAVILSHLENEHSIQAQLTTRVLISVLFPVLPLLLLVSGYRKAMNAYCED